MPVPGPSIIPADNDPNWEDAHTTNPITNLAANRPTSSTRSWSKPCQSDNTNTNEQLAKVFGRLANTLNTNQTPGPNTNSRGTKACIPDTFSGTEPDKLNNFLFQYRLYFRANPVQFDTDIVKINFVMTYLTGVAQDWFEVGLNQEDQGILQDWLSNWNLFVDELHRHFGLSDPVSKAANILDNLCMKPSDKISTYNVDFMCYASQLGWRNTPWVDLSSKLASNGKLTSNECKKCLKNNLCLYCGVGDHKLDSCPKKQTMVSPKGCGASATADTLAAASEKPLEK